MVHIGIDYSQTSPSLAVYDSNKDLAFENIEYHSVSYQYKIRSFDNFHFTHLNKNWTTNEERYDGLINWVLSIVDKYKPEEVAPIIIEGYSMGSKGQIFNLAENCGVMKYVLWLRGFKYETPSPSTIKKFATKSGAATKEYMYEQWIKDTGFHLKEAIQPTRKLGSPTTDIVDAHYMLMYGVNKYA